MGRCGRWLLCVAGAVVMCSWLLFVGVVGCCCVSVVAVCCCLLFVVLVRFAVGPVQCAAYC